MSNRWLLIVVAVVFATAVLFYGAGASATLRHGQVSDHKGQVSDRERNSAADGGPQAESLKVLPTAVAATEVAALPFCPDPFGGFWGWSVERQQLAVTAFQRNSDLSQAHLDFFLQLVARPEVDDLVKNNAMNALIKQGARPASLGMCLRDAIFDRRQSAVWREYAVQHIVSLVEMDQPPERDESLLILREVIRQGGSIAVTALIRMQDLSEEMMPNGHEFIHSEVDRLLLTESDPLAIGGLLGVIGQAGWSDLAPRVRVFAKSTNVEVRRSALAALGTTGGREDLAILTLNCDDSDELIRKSARASRERLLARLHEN